jgi:hypothetical protein
MRRIELAALRTTRLSWEQLGEVTNPTLEPLGLAPDGSDVKVELHDRGDNGRVLIIPNFALARRAARALATKTGGPVSIFEVVGTAGGTRFRFRTEAWEATATGELKPAEGAELDLEGDGGWIGSLAEQAHQVLDAFARFEYGASQSATRGYKKRKAGKPSSPRVAALLASLQKAKHHEAVPQPEGRVELRIELAAGGKQKSYCSAAEYEELERLLQG